MTEKLLTPDQDKINEAIEFINGFSSAIMSTVTETALPHSSYAPHICHDNHFYVYVSGLAKHASTLKNGHACLFFVEDESKAKTVFARRRLTLDCKVEPVKKNADTYSPILDIFEAQRGPTIKMLRTLPDFVLYELSPQNAHFVTGFGAAYDLSHVLSSLTESH